MHDQLSIVVQVQNIDYMYDREQLFTLKKKWRVMVFYLINDISSMQVKIFVE